MVYVAVLGVFMNLAAMTFLALSDTTHVVGKYSGTLSAVDGFRRKLTEDVAVCGKIVREAGELEADERLLLLEMADGSIRAWGPGPNGEGLVHFDIVKGKRSEGVGVLRRGQVRFRAIARQKRAAGVIVEVALRDYSKFTASVRSGPFVSFSALREAR